VSGLSERKQAGGGIVGIIERKRARSGIHNHRTWLFGPGLCWGDEQRNHLAIARGGVFPNSTAIAEISGFMKKASLAG
jgi:hypothetical protein